MKIIKNMYQNKISVDSSCILIMNLFLKCPLHPFYLFYFLSCFSCIYYKLDIIDIVRAHANEENFNHDFSPTEQSPERLGANHPLSQTGFYLTNNVLNLGMPDIRVMYSLQADNRDVGKWIYSDTVKTRKLKTGFLLFR